MTKVLLIRHGQSANNASAEHERVSDPDLTDLGRTQAQKLATQFAEEPRITHLYCSAFRRALETVRPIAEHLQLPVAIRADLFEQGGCYSGFGNNRLGEAGLGASELRTEFPQWDVDTRISDEGWWGRPYESWQAAKRRTAEVVTWLRESIAPQIGVHAFVIHADFKSLLLDELLPEVAPSTYIPLYNTSVTELAWHNDQWQLVSLNEVAHLPSEHHSY